MASADPSYHPLLHGVAQCRFFDVKPFKRSKHYVAVSYWWASLEPNCVLNTPSPRYYATNVSHVYVAHDSRDTFRVRYCSSLLSLAMSECVVVDFMRFLMADLEGVTG